MLTDHMQSGPPFSTYTLLDSGGGEKLERFGDIILSRPSSLSLWEKRLPQIWTKADATFVPGKGWRFKSASFESRTIKIFDFSFTIFLQSNGQIGVFPEHGYYLPQVRDTINRLENKCSVLNLFAYTGLATTYCALSGAQVTHVDLSKKALTWARQNLVLNKVENSKVRLITEDAISFLEREVRRKNVYEVLIVDPPSFSRTSKSKSWKLEEIVKDLVASCVRVLNPEQGALFLSCHAPEIGAETLSNLVFDAVKNGSAVINHFNLSLPENSTPRLLPSGFLVSCVY